MTASMNFVVQSLHNNPASLEQIARITGAARITTINTPAACFAWRCEDVKHTPEIRQKVAEACHYAGMDGNFIAAQRDWREFTLLAMDMDSTLITIECIDEIADMQGIKPQVAEITEAAMRGEIGFNESLIRRVGLLKGLDASALQRVYDERLQLSPGAETMLACARQHGLKTLLVSGGFTFFTERMQARLGLDYTYSNQLEIIDGKLTGKVLGEIVNAEKKRAYVETTCAELGCASSAAIAMGDGANDLLMMGIAGLSVAFRAKPAVKQQADVGFDFVGLDGMLALLGK